MDDTVQAQDVALGIAQRSPGHVDAVGEVFRIVNGQFAVHQVIQLELGLVDLGKVECLEVIHVIARVDNGVVDDDLPDGVALVFVEEIIPCRSAHQVGILLIDRLQVLVDGIVRRCKDRVVTAGREQLGHRTLTQLGDGNHLQQFDILVVGLVLPQVGHHRIVLEDVAGRRVNIFLTGVQYDGCKDCEA